MKWSKLKKVIEDQFVECVQGRVELRRTWYRRTHDFMERAWITFDGREIWRFRDFLGDNRPPREDLPAPDELKEPGTVKFEDWLTVQEDPLYHSQELGKAMHKVLTSNIEDLLQSDNSIERALGILDRRCGKRRLEKLSLKREKLLVKRAYFIRLHCQQSLTRIPGARVPGSS
jgi:hypothetical protein